MKTSSCMASTACVSDSWRPLAMPETCRPKETNSCSEACRGSLEEPMVSSDTARCSTSSESDREVPSRPMPGLPGDAEICWSGLIDDSGDCRSEALLAEGAGRGSRISAWKTLCMIFVSTPHSLVALGSTLYSWLLPQSLRSGRSELLDGLSTSFSRAIFVLMSRVMACSGSSSSSAWIEGMSRLGRQTLEVSSPSCTRTRPSPSVMLSTATWTSRSTSPEAFGSSVVMPENTSSRRRFSCASVSERLWEPAKPRRERSLWNFSSMTCVMTSRASHFMERMSSWVVAAGTLRSVGHGTPSWPHCAMRS
mmetsp:Transcript_23123/g.68820  ORF Transcript_23123/g.68820 Transcript_23123/m.68820 type:complete len:308 (+) Transcript_23123:405-1328(+)